MRRPPAMTARRGLAVLASLCAALLLSACVPAGLPTEGPSIVGRAETVTGAQRGQSMRTMLVRSEAGDVDAGEVDAASVTVTRDTKVFAGSREEPRNAAPEDISEGDRVMVWFSGPVAESYPVQATAGTVLILE